MKSYVKRFFCRSWGFICSNCKLVVWNSCFFLNTSCKIVGSNSDPFQGVCSTGLFVIIFLEYCLYHLVIFPRPIFSSFTMSTFFSPFPAVRQSLYITSWSQFFCHAWCRRDRRRLLWWILSHETLWVYQGEVLRSDQLYQIISPYFEWYP